MTRRVEITSDGRDGRVLYRDGARVINGYWEFGGGDVVTIVSMGTADEWRAGPSWALGERAAILQFVADEVIRQRAPSCSAEIDDAGGVILLRQIPGRTPPPPHANRPKARAFLERYRDIRAKFAVGVLVATLIVGALMWFGTNGSSGQTARGVPLNDAVRYTSLENGGADGVASLIQSADARGPRWTGRGDPNATSSISVALIPVDGGRPQKVSVARNLTNNAYALARIIGSDGRTLWLDVGGLHGVRLRDYKLIGPKELQIANPSLDISWWEDPRGMDIVAGRLHIVRADRSAALDIAPDTLAATSAKPVVSNARFSRDDTANHLASGLRIAPDAWLGLHSADDLAGAFRSGRWVRPIENADETKSLRRLTRARLGASSEGGRRRIDSIAPVSDTTYLSAAFLRMNATSEPLRLTSPDGALMIHTSAPGLAGTLVVSRVDANGEIVWSVDTGLDRFRLERILPGEDVVAFVGPRLPVPDVLSEPFVMLIDTKTGKLTTQTLWR